ncbi:uncharacterized protein LY79DRAFT_38531 [Colletotrichum navitas]|uniref:Uncharacterized protein n=1 Tax=Colletotrichum navitas TaxID=681940 RepID=A0AAD8PMT9_9PEZI|nr:uncharacterized protein LY79DRAFT_38531 [Colletotrichum navitas]KAK1573024.1 hypothetical protein LY79DRAFT_38531 [Colletotrichum navitas]
MGASVPTWGQEACGAHNRYNFIDVDWVDPSDEALSNQPTSYHRIRQPHQQRSMPVLSTLEDWVPVVFPRHGSAPSSLSAARIHLILFLCFTPHPLALRHWCSRRTSNTELGNEFPPPQLITTLQSYPHQRSGRPIPALSGPIHRYLLQCALLASVLNGTPMLPLII